VIEKDRAGVRQRDVAPVAVQQRHAQLPLQFLNLDAERGLCDAQRFRGAAEVQMFGYGDKVSQKPQFYNIVHISSLAD